MKLHEQDVDVIAAAVIPLSCQELCTSCTFSSSLFLVFVLSQQLDSLFILFAILQYKAHINLFFYVFDWSVLLEDMTALL